MKLITPGRIVLHVIQNASGSNLYVNIIAKLEGLVCFSCCALVMLHLNRGLRLWGIRDLA
jgi:hypothetical protein